MEYHDLWLKGREGNFIAYEDLVDKEVYIVDARNFKIALFMQVIEGFEGVREKFGTTFIDIEYHYDKGAPFGTVRPLRKATLLEKQEWFKEAIEASK